MEQKLCASGRPETTEARTAPAPVQVTAETSVENKQYPKQQSSTSCDLNIVYFVCLVDVQRQPLREDNMLEH